MKYAFIIGSNAFIVPSKVIIYEDSEGEKEFLRINALCSDVPPNVQQSALSIDIDIQDEDGSPIMILANGLVAGPVYSIERERDSIKVLRADGSLVIQVHQIDYKTAMGLEHNISAELEIYPQIAIIRITGEFLLGGMHIAAENEKLYIDQTGYGNSVQTGKNQLKFAPEGVVL
jgi:hypothetical protein